MRKSTSVLMPRVERSHTLPPSPPSPPSGPPKGTNFSRRKLALPRPPLPARTRRVASSTNFMGRLRAAARHQVGPSAPGGRRSSVRLGNGNRRSRGLGARLGGRLHAHIHTLLGAALTDQDVTGEHILTTEALHTQALGVRIAAIACTTACLLMCHETAPSPLG